MSLEIILLIVIEVLAGMGLLWYKLGKLTSIVKNHSKLLADILEAITDNNKKKGD